MFTFSIASKNILNKRLALVFFNLFLVTGMLLFVPKFAAAEDAAAPIRMFLELPQSQAILNNAAVSEHLDVAVSQSMAVAIHPDLMQNPDQWMGKSLAIPLFDKTVYATIDRVNHTTGAKGFRARINGSEYSYAILSSHDGLASGSVELVETGEHYLILSNKAMRSQYLVVADDTSAPSLEGGPSLTPPPLAAQQGTQPQNTMVQTDSTLPATVDVLIVYTPAAQAFADASHGGMENLLSNIMLRNQTVLDNSDTGITMEMVFSSLVNYTEARDSSNPSYTDSLTDLYELTDNDGNDSLDIVHLWRDQYGADLVHILTDCNDTGGLAWLLNTPSGRPAYAFALSRVRQVSYTFTVIHEMGHNMGLGHHVDQNYQWGPGLYPYSAGWRWTGTDSGRYCSVMTYESGAYFDDGITHTRVAHFSNPSILYASVPTGNATEGDSARSLREIKHVIAAYRSRPAGGDEYEPDNTAATAKPIVAGTAQTHSIVPTGDVDWVQFTLDETSSIIIETSGPTNADTVMGLYASNGSTLIVEDDDGGANLYSRIERLSTNGEALSAGTYFVRVNEYGDNNEIPSYDILLTILPMEHSLTYLAGPNGSIVGAANQTVAHGSDGSAVEALPTGGYHFVEWSDGSTSNPRTDRNVLSDLSVTAEFALGNYTLTYTAGTGGSITGTATQEVAHGEDGSTVEATPLTGYHFTQWSDGLETSSRTELDVKSNRSVEALFALNTYTLSYSAGTGGTVTGTTLQNVLHGQDGTQVTALPATGYEFIDWSDGSTTNPRTDVNVQGNLAVTATFALKEYTLEYLAGANGYLSGNTLQTVSHGSNGSTVTAVADTGYHFSVWSDASTQNPRLDENVTADQAVTATFELNQYDVTYWAGAGGSLSGSSAQIVNHGSDTSPITAVPDNGYIFSMWSDGLTDNPRTDLDLQDDLTVTAVFEIIDYYGHFHIVSSPNVQPLYTTSGIYLPPFDGFGVLKIVRKPGFDTYPEIPGIYADGSLRLLYSQATVDQVFVAGTLLRAVAPGAHFREMKVHDLGVAAMVAYARSSSSLGAEEASTTIHSGDDVTILTDADDQPYAEVAIAMASGSIDPYLRPCVVRLTGVSLVELTAPNQFLTLRMSPKRFAWRDEAGHRHVDISLSRIPYTEGKRLEAAHLRLIAILGGGTHYTDSTAAVAIGQIVGNARVEGNRGSTRILSRGLNLLVIEPDPLTGEAIRTIETYDGTFAPTSLTLGAEYLNLTVVSGDLAVESIRTSGTIQLLRSVRGEVLTPMVQAGLDVNVERPDIRRIMGDYGITGSFQAGIGLDGLPNRKGLIYLMYTNNYLEPAAQINAEAWVAEDIVRLIGDTEAKDEERLIFR